MTDDSPSRGEAPCVVDLTNAHLHTLDAVDLPANLKALDLTANRLKDIDPRILNLTGLVALNFRQNLLTDVACLGSSRAKATLEDIECRDTQLKELPVLQGFSRLRRLDFSYNEIRSMQPLLQLGPSSSLQELYLANNKVGTIEALAELTALTTLELGSNRLRKIEQLQSQALLQELWLGSNRISLIENLSHLTALRRISIQSNRLESMLGLEGCTALEELYLSHNGIWKLEGLSTLTQLKVLDVSSNRISKVENLKPLTQLEDLWLNNNNIATLDGLDTALSAQRDCLTTIYLEGNAAAKQPGYKATMLALLPKLEQLDANVL